MQATSEWLDVSQCPFAGDDIYALDGEWDFYWQQFLVTDRDRQPASQPSSKIEVPSYWHNLYLLNTNMPVEGFATYRTKLKLPPSQVGKPLAIRISNVRIASRLHVDGELLAQSGQPAKNRAAEYARNKPYVGEFVPQQALVTLDLEVSNYHNSSLAGFNHSVMLGSAAALESLTDRNTAYDIFIASFVLCMAIFFLGKWLIEPCQLIHLWFALLLFFMLGFVVTQSEKLVYHIWPTLDYTIYSRTYILTAFMGHTATFLCLYYSFPTVVPRRLVNWAMGISAGFILYVMFTNVYHFNVLTGFLIFYGLPILVYGFYLFWRAWMQGQPGGFFFFTAMFSGILSVTLWAANFIFTFDLYDAPPILVPLMVVSIGLAFHAQQTAMKEKLNRTELAKLRHQIKPHFLFNTISTIIWASERDAGLARQLLHDLSDFLRGSFDFEDREQVVSFSKEVELTKAYLAIESVRFGEQLQVVWQVDERLLESDVKLPPLILQPLVENAVRHGLRNQEIMGKVRIVAERVGDRLNVIIEDDGVGFSAEQLKAFREERYNQLSPDGGGVGLQNVQLRLQAQYRTGLRLENRADGGAAVRFSVNI